MKFLNEINKIDLVKVLEKYVGEDEFQVIPEGLYLIINPCPRCGHNDCCKINTANNTLACWGKCKAYYQDTVKTLCWLLGLSRKESIMKLVVDFNLKLPQDFKKEIAIYQMKLERREALTRFVELCHQRLTKEYRDYWKKRGLSEDIIDKFKLGICPGDGSIISQMLKEGFLGEDLKCYGLVGHGVEHFSGKHAGKYIPYFTLPNWYKEQVVGIQGRICNLEGKDIPLKKYKNPPGDIEELFNPEALREEVVYVTEGIPDALSLIQMGYPTVCGYGAGGIKEHWLPRFVAKKGVYIVFDSDEVGRDQAYELSRKIGETARVISLNGVKDVNELLVQHGTEQARKVIEQLTQEAKTALQIDIDNLPAERQKIDEQVMKKIIFKILDLSPIYRVAYIELLKAHLCCSKKDIEDTLRYYKEEWERKSVLKETEEKKGNLVFEADPQYVRLAQCFANGKVYMAQTFQEERGKGNSTYRARAIRVLTSEHTCLIPPEKVSNDIDEIISWKTDGNELLLKRPLTSAEKRWSKTGSPYSINRFLEGSEEKVSIVSLYKQIEDIFRKFYFTKEGYDYIFLSLFTMLTYYYELYDSVPYLYFNGEPESGKTTLCLLLQSLAFNGDLVSSISTSSLFREAETKQLTLILDEQEGIASKRAAEEKGEYIALLKDAYKRTGTVKRQSSSNYEITEEFQVFSPLVIANVYGLESILRTRVIQINTEPAPKEAVKDLSPLRPSAPEFIKEVQFIRDQLYCWVMQSHLDLRELVHFEMKDEVNNRAAELFSPIFALATYIELSGGKEFKLLERLHNGLPSKLMKRSSFKTKDPVQLLKEACRSLLLEQDPEKKENGVWISTLDIFDRFVELNGQYQNYMTLQWIGDKIISSGLLTNKNDRDRKERKTYIRDPKTNLVKDYCLEEKKKVTLYFLRHSSFRGDTDATE